MSNTASLMDLLFGDYRQRSLAVLLLLTLAGLFRKTHSASGWTAETPSPPAC